MCSPVRGAGRIGTREPSGLSPRIRPAPRIAAPDTSRQPGRNARPPLRPPSSSVPATPPTAGNSGTGSSR